MELARQLRVVRYRGFLMSERASSHIFQGRRLRDALRLHIRRLRDAGAHAEGLGEVLGAGAIIAHPQNEASTDIPSVVRREPGAVRPRRQAATLATSRDGREERRVHLGRARTRYIENRRRREGTCRLHQVVCRTFPPCCDDTSQVNRLWSSKPPLVE